MDLTTTSLNLSPSLKPQFRNYTAIGDSYTSGDGDYVTLSGDPNQACRRTASSYPYQFLKTYGTRLNSFNFPACSGADTDGVTSQIDSGSISSSFPQINYDFGTPDLVSVTAGGDNNEIFTDTITACVVQLLFKPPTDPVYLQNCENNLTAAANTISNIQSKLEAVYADAKTRNLLSGQQRSIFVLGYAQFYNLNSTVDACDQVFDFKVPSLGPTGIASQINALVLSMNDMIKKAAASQGVTYVDIDQSFIGHRICDVPDNNVTSVVEFQKSLKQYFFNMATYAPFHPTTEGYESMMNDFARAAGFR